MTCASFRSMASHTCSPERPGMDGRLAWPLGRRDARRRDEQLRSTRSAYWWATAWRASRPTLRLIERFTRIDAETLDYEFTMTDPAMFTRPVDGAIPADHQPGLTRRHRGAACTSTRATKGTTASPTCCEGRGWGKNEICRISFRRTFDSDVSPPIGSRLSFRVRDSASQKLPTRQFRPVRAGAAGCGRRRRERHEILLADRPGRRGVLTPDQVGGDRLVRAQPTGRATLRPSHSRSEATSSATGPPGVSAPWVASRRVVARSPRSRTGEFRCGESTGPCTDRLSAPGHSAQMLDATSRSARSTRTLRPPRSRPLPPREIIGRGYPASLQATPGNPSMKF